MADVDKVMWQLDEAMYAAGFGVDSMSLGDEVVRTYRTEGTSLTVDASRSDPDEWRVRLHLPGRMYAVADETMDLDGQPAHVVAQVVLATMTRMLVGASRRECDA